MREGEEEKVIVGSKSIRAKEKREKKYTYKRTSRAVKLRENGEKSKI